MVKKNACVFISGKGTNLKNLIDKSRDSSFPIKIKLVISNNINALGIKIARKNSITYKIINTKLRNYETNLINILKFNKISLICLAGYMKILPKRLIRKFENKVINIHPSLLPKFKGLNTYSKIIKRREVKTGCSVHFVNEKLDDGKIIIQKSFFINQNYDENYLKNRTQKLEYLAYPEAIISLFRSKKFKKKT
tara:strand:- start:51 stop:632 length:582 start_codon:yes stop_codon:yes gene_type:complete